jgi:hypothetical protein
MVLTDSQMVGDNWGDRKARKTKTDYDGGYHDEASYECISFYSSTFILAFDSEAEFELKCLAGTKTVSAAITEQIIPAHNYGLLARLLDVVEAKKHCHLDAEPCRSLLQMLLHSKDKSRHTVAVINRILVASPSKEPNTHLWDTIVVLVKKFGWKSLRDSVSHLLYDEARKRESHGNITRSRISLRVFLDRVEFALKLRMIKFIEYEAINFSEVSISDSSTDLANSDNKSLTVTDVRLVIAKIEGMDSEFGLNEQIVKSSLDVLKTNAPKSNMFSLLVQGAFFIDISKNYKRAANDCLVDFATSFTAELSKSYNSSYIRFNWLNIEPHQTMFLKCTLAVPAYGAQNDLDLLGKALVHHEEILPLLFKVLTETSTESTTSPNHFFDIINRCLVHQSIPLGKRTMAKFRKCFELCPSMASSGDEHGRLPLHYAASRAENPCETIDFILEKHTVAATIRDPIKGLYPFMMAGSVGNHAAFRLLLADPNLVIGGILAESKCEEGRKRKRGLSLSSE